MSRDSHERTFQSREIIWNTFESMSRELGVPIDELVNEAMAAYARVRGYPMPGGPLARTGGNPAVGRGVAPAPARHGGRMEERDLEETHDAVLSPLDRSYAPGPGGGYIDDDDLARTSVRGHPRPAAGRPIEDVDEETRTAPRRSAFGRSGSMPAALGRMPAPAAPTTRSSEVHGARPPVPPPLPPRTMPSTTMPMPGAPQRDPSQAKRLVLTYQGRQFAVDKDRYLIGRSKAQSDLRLDDPNVSRQHAVIERVGSAWYVVDLGSTNGVHVAGERIARRALSDGDVIVITSHEIRCSFR
jgi:hypothetical protein